MKKINKFLFFLIIVLFTGCLFSKKKERNSVKQTTSFDKKFVDGFEENFIVEIYFQATRNDLLQVFYLTKNFEKYFLGNQSVMSPFNGRDSEQKVKIELPSDSVPTRIRIDFGNNKKQHQIRIDSIRFLYEDRMLVFRDSIFDKYFTPNKFIDVNNNVLLLKRENNSAYDPYAIGSADLNNKLKEFTNF